MLPQEPSSRLADGGFKAPTVFEICYLEGIGKKPSCHDCCPKECALSDNNTITYRPTGSKNSLPTLAASSLKLKNKEICCLHDAANN